MGVLFACDPQQPTDAARALDPRVGQLSQWVPYRHPVHGSLYFLSRFELRQEDVPPDGPPDPSARPITIADLPRVRVDFVQANWLGRFYFGRLPRADEWRFAVEGQDGWRYPWGDNHHNVLLANTFELGIYRRTRVGTFESGRDPARRDSCYDLIGNVQEWTSTPFIEVLLSRIHRGTLVDAFDNKVIEFRGLHDEFLVSIPGAAPFDPWGYASPFVAEALRSLADPQIEGLEWIALGFGYDQDLESGIVRDADWYRRLGVDPRLPAEWTDSLGVRLATDPLTFLIRLGEAEGRPSAQEIRMLGGFVGRYLSEFRIAARTLSQLDRETLGMSEPGDWARAAMQILGMRW